MSLLDEIKAMDVTGGSTQAKTPSDRAGFQVVVGDNSKTKDGITANNPTGGLPLTFIPDGDTDWFSEDDDDDVVSTRPADDSMYRDGKLKSYEDAMSDWDKMHPEPTAPTLSTAQVKAPMSYDDILAQYDASQKVNSEKEAKRARQRRNLATLVDGLNAITNLVGTANGADQTYDPSTNAMSQYQARADKIAAQQAETRKAYQDLAYKRAALAQKQYETDVKSQNSANSSAMSQYQKDRTAWQNARKAYGTAFNQERTYNRNVGNDEWNRNFKTERAKVEDEHSDRSYNLQKAGTTSTVNVYGSGSHEAFNPNTGAKEKLTSSSHSTRTTTTRPNVRR